MTSSKHPLLEKLCSLKSCKDQPHFRWGLFFLRLVTLFVAISLVRGLRSFAFYNARWPPPIKYFGIGSIFLAAVFLAFSLVMIWKILYQLGIKRVMIILITFCGTVVVIAQASRKDPLPFDKVVWLTIKRKAKNTITYILETPEEFKFHYTGRRDPILLPGMDPDDESYLTPIPANRPAIEEDGAE